MSSREGVMKDRIIVHWIRTALSYGVLAVSLAVRVASRSAGAWTEV